MHIKIIPDSLWIYCQENKNSFRWQFTAHKARMIKNKPGKGNFFHTANGRGEQKLLNPLFKFNNKGIR